MEHFAAIVAYLDLFIGDECLSPEGVSWGGGDSHSPLLGLNRPPLISQSLYTCASHFYQGKTKHILKLSIDSGGEDVLYDSGTSAMDGTLALHMEIFIILPKKSNGL